jgi:hypothetical protein
MNAINRNVANDEKNVADDLSLSPMNKMIDNMIDNGNKVYSPRNLPPTKKDNKKIANDVTV